MTTGTMKKLARRWINSIETKSDALLTKSDALFGAFQLQKKRTQQQPVTHGKKTDTAPIK
jgi:hypothetical protein